MNELQIDEMIDETKELFDRVMTNIRDDFEGYILKSKDQPDDDLQYYSALSEKDKTFNIAAAIMARTSAIYQVDVIKWVEELLLHNTGIEHKLEVYRRANTDPE